MTAKVIVWFRSSPGHRLFMIVAGVTWAIVLVGGAVPAWHVAHRQDHDMQAESARLASLDAWSVAGVWYAAAAERWQPEQQAVYERQFPATKQREALFLEITRVARESRVDPVTVTEVPSHAESFEQGDLGEDDGGTAADPEVAMLVDQFMPDQSGMPSAHLDPYRLRISFSADYVHTARFVAGLQSIERALNLQMLHAEPSRGEIAVEMELEYYAQQSD